MRRNMLTMTWHIGLLAVILASIPAYGAMSPKFFKGKVDDGTIYFAPDGRASAYVFTVYMGEGDFPTREEIIGQVARYRQERL